MDDQNLLKELEEQEKLLQFTEFTSETALKIGLMLIERAKKEGKGIAIDITRDGRQLFHFACDGTNFERIAGKNRMVRHSHHSSYYCGVLVKQSGKTLEEIFHVSSNDHIASGGSFPIIIRNAGVIGTIALAGMPGPMDHAYVVDAIKAYLGL